MSKCQDCHSEYDIDFLIQAYLWEMISPTRNYAGLLCPSCMIDRMMKLRINGRKLTAIHATIDVSEFINPNSGDRKAAHDD